MLLIGDVGATKTDLAVITLAAGPRAPLAEATFTSAQYSGLDAVVREFLSHVDACVERACFGVAGPVASGRAKLTNLGWAVDAKRLQKSFGFSSVSLLNDLEAIANGIPYLEADEVDTLNAGTPVRGGAIAVLAPGTGLGEAFLTWDGKRYRAHASEGSHVDFAPTDRFQMELLSSLWHQYDHVSVERICSGLGIPNIYRVLKAESAVYEPAWLAEQLAAANDPTPIIVNAALDASRPCELCRKTLDLFVAILGAEAGNLALKLLATGGVYLAGGIPLRILPVLKQGNFMEAFQRKGRYAELLARMPVHVVLYPKVALLGAAYHGLQMQVE